MKYINAEKLLAEIDRLHQAHSGKYGCDEVGLNLEYLEDFITSLQQEQQIGEEYAIEIGKHTHTIRVGSQSDIDNLIRQEKQQEQPEVDLDVEIKKMLNSDYYKRHIKPSPYVIDVINYTARYFYELVLNARKEE